MINILICIIIVITIILVLYILLPISNTNKLIPGVNKNTHFTNVITKKIYMSYKTKNIPDYIIPTWMKLNPTYDVVLYDNMDCINFLRTYYDQKYVDIFNYIKDGPIKADFWRMCILYKFGGVYTDIDIKPMIPIKDFIETDVTFLTCLSAVGLHESNPHFIISNEPGNIVLKYCINTYIEKYDNKDKYSYWGWSVTAMMRKAINKHFGYVIKEEGVYTDMDGYKYQFLQEVAPSYKSIKDHYCEYKNKIILYNRYDNYNDHSF